MTRNIPDTRLDEYVQSCGPVSMSELQNRIVFTVNTTYCVV